MRGGRQSSDVENPIFNFLDKARSIHSLFIYMQNQPMTGMSYVDMSISVCVLCRVSNT